MTDCRCLRSSGVSERLFRGERSRDRSRRRSLDLERRLRSSSLRLRSSSSRRRRSSSLRSLDERLPSSRWRLSSSRRSRSLSERSRSLSERRSLSRPPSSRRRSERAVAGLKGLPDAEFRCSPFPSPFACGSASGGPERTAGRDASEKAENAISGGPEKRRPRRRHAANYLQTDTPPSQRRSMGAGEGKYFAVRRKLELAGCNANPKGERNRQSRCTNAHRRGHAQIRYSRNGSGSGWTRCVRRQGVSIGADAGSWRRSGRRTRTSSLCCKRYDFIRHRLRSEDFRVSQVRFSGPRLVPWFRRTGPCTLRRISSIHP